MPSRSLTIWAQFWYQALASPLGIGLRSRDPVRLKNVLYTARANLHDPSLKSLSIRTAPDSPTNTLWIVKGQNGTQDQDEERTPHGR